MTEKTGFKYSIKANQSMSSGMFALEGYYAFDDPKDFNPNRLVAMLHAQEIAFTNKGYKVVSIIPNNMRDLANNKSKAQGVQALKNEAGIVGEAGPERVDLDPDKKKKKTGTGGT